MSPAGDSVLFREQGYGAEICRDSGDVGVGVDVLVSLYARIPGISNDGCYSLTIIATCRLRPMLCREIGIHHRNIVPCHCVRLI